MTDKTVEVVVTEEFARNPKLILHARIQPTHEAVFAMQCIERWALVSATPDGEDSAGRQKLRRLTTTELVTEACEAAKVAFEMFRERGWLVDIPAWAELKETHDKTDEERLNERKKK